MSWLPYVGAAVVAGLMATSAILAAENADGGWSAVGAAVGDDGQGHSVQIQISGQGNANTAMQVQVGPNAQMIVQPMIKAAFLGVITSPVPEVLAEHLKLGKGVGLVVDFVEPGSPAAAAEIRKNDVLTKFDDQVLINVAQLATLVRARKPKDKVALTLIREGKEQKATAELVEREMPAQAAADAVALLTLVPNMNGPANAAPNVANLMTRRNAAGGGMATSSATLNDGEHVLTLTSTNGVKTLTAKDKDGKVLFEGPIGTREDRSKVPPEILKKLSQMEQSVRMEMRVGGNPANLLLQGMGGGGIRMMPGMNGLQMFSRRRPTESQTLADGEYSLDLSKTPDGKYLVAKDKNDKVVFDGLVQTEEQRQKVPPEVLKRLETLEKSHRGEASLIEDGMTVTIVADDGRQKVTAKDVSGKVLFEGPIDTEEQRAKMPEKVRTKVEKLWKSCATIGSASGN